MSYGNLIEKRFNYDLTAYTVPGKDKPTAFKYMGRLIAYCTESAEQFKKVQVRYIRDNEINLEKNRPFQMYTKLTATN
jgi:hypothetical protein